MYALRQDAFYLTGFDPDVGDPQQDTKDLLNSLIRASQSQLRAPMPVEHPAPESSQSTL